jgi:Mn-dependent DtxR family transcriptional regulator
MAAESGSNAAFTPRQGQYLAFTYYYTKLNRIALTEADFARYFGVSAPSVHQMIIKLEAAGWISRTPGQGRSIRLRVARDELPDLE